MLYIIRFLTAVSILPLLQLVFPYSPTHILQQPHLSKHWEQRSQPLFQNIQKSKQLSGRSLQTIDLLNIRTIQYNKQQLNIQDQIQFEIQKLNKNEEIKDEIYKIFERFPSEQQLDKMVSDIDVFVISKTIQILVNEQNLGCQKKIEYLSFLKGLILKVIQQRKYDLNKARVVQNIAQTQIERLLIQLREQLLNLSKLDVKQYEQKINIQISSLQYLYALYNEVKLQLNVTKSRISKVKSIIKQKQISFRNIVKEKNNIINNKTIDNQKQRIEKIYELQINIFTQQKVLAKLKNDYLLYKAYLKRKQTQSDTLRRIYLKLQVQTQRTRQVLNNMKLQKDKIKQKINTINQQLSMYRKNTNSGKPQSLQIDIFKLQTTLNNLRQQTDIIHYYCYDLDIQNAQDYEQSIDEFRYFVQQRYKIDQNKISQMQGIQYINIIPIDIFSSSFKDQFQKATQEDIIIVNVLLPDGQIIQYNYSCIQPSTIIRGLQKTQDIFNNCLVIRYQNGIQYNIHVGICFPLQNNQQPLQGKRIFWKGNQLERVVEVRAGTCI